MTSNWQFILACILISLSFWGIWSLIFKGLLKWFNSGDEKVLIEIDDHKKENMALEIDNLKSDLKYSLDTINELKASLIKKDEYIVQLSIQIEQKKNI